MKSSSLWKKITFLAALALGGLSLQAYAGPELLPKDWHARPPYHLKSKFATSSPTGLSPAQIKKAYGFPANLQGSGQVIAIVDAMDNPNAEADLNVFSTAFGLPACTTANGCFQKIYASGTAPTGDTGWGVEMSLDVQWAHAIAPAAKILLIEASDNGYGLYEAINVAIQNHATVISCSWGGSEFNGETSFDSFFKNSPVPIVVSSGDSGSGVMYPAASPYVLSVGGTYLTLNSSGNIQSETAWSGSSGGLSTYEIEPAYQTTFPIPQDPSKARGVPDVSYNASPASGVSIYDSYGQGGWLVVGGTSAGAPQWAALIALANSSAGKNISTANTELYSAALKSYSTMYNDISAGTNGSCGYYCQAMAGYDYVTGLGSPMVSTLISYLTNPSQTCVRANPAVSFAPPSQTVPAGSSATYTLTVTNQDNAVCPASTFSLNGTLPSGLTGTLSQNSLPLAAGKSGTVTLTVNSTSSTSAGTYNVAATATNSGATSYKGTANATFIATSTCVRATPVISISPCTQSASGTKATTYTVSITDRDSSSCGQSIFGFAANGSPYGLTTFMEPYNLIIYPGMTLTSELIVTPLPTATAGTYAITVTGGTNTNRGIAAATLIYTK